MRVVIHVVLLIGAMLLATFLLRERSRAQKDGGSAYHKVTVEETKKKMQDTKDFTLLDVCTQEEFSEQHIPGATLIVDSQISAEARKRLLDKDIPTFVYCRGGRRSAGATNQLINMGHTQIHDFDGITGWPYGAVSGSEQQ